MLNAARPRLPIAMGLALLLIPLLALIPPAGLISSGLISSGLVQSAFARDQQLDEGKLAPMDDRLERIVEAARKGDRKTLQAIVDGETDETGFAWGGEPWIMAHELVLRGHARAAVALARASKREDLDQLAEYVRVLERKAPSTYLWLQMLRAVQGLKQGRWSDVLEVVAACEKYLQRPTVVTVQLLRAKARALRVLDEHAESCVPSRAAAKTAAALGWWSNSVDAHQNWFASAYRCGEAEDMLACCRSWLGVYMLTGQRAKAARVLADQASIEGSLGRYAEALTLYKTVIKKYGKELSHGVLGHIQSQAGLAAMNLGRLADAQQMASRAQATLRKAVFEAHGKPVQLAEELDRESWASVVHAMVAVKIRDFDEAQRLFQRGIQLLTLAQETHFVEDRLPKLAEIRGNLAVLEVEKLRAGRGDVEIARAAMVAALQEFRQYGRRDYILRAEANLAEVDRHAGAYARALSSLRRIAKEQKASGDRAGLCETLCETATVYRLQGMLEHALLQQKKALVLAEDLTTSDVVTTALTGLAEIHLVRKDFGEALEAARDAVAHLTFLFDRLAPGQAALARGRTGPVYDVGLRAALALKSIDDACYFLDGGRAGALLVNLRGRSFMRAAHVDPALLAEAEAARQAEATASMAFAASSRSGKLSKVRAARETLERARLARKTIIQRVQLEAAIDADLRQDEPASRAEIQASLDSGEAMILYGQAGSRLVALVLTPKDARLVDLRSWKKVHEACAALRTGPEDEDVKASARKLRALVVRPLRLKAAVKRVLMSPVGCLAYASPALLFPGREVCAVTSGTTHARLKLKQVVGTGQVLAMGNPDYGPPPLGWESASTVRGGRLVPLPGTGKEAVAVGDVVLLGAQASETNLREKLLWFQGEGRHLRALHLACHGRVDEDRPGFSALALTATAEDNGLLTALEVYQLTIDADLVILSACESGKGRSVRAEGIVGLTNAFLFAGARRVLVSLWKVDDEASRELMTTFHAHWNHPDPKKRLGAAAALRRAQVHVKTYAKMHGGAHPEWSHPHYWAAWQLWGPSE